MTGPAWEQCRWTGRWRKHSDLPLATRSRNLEEMPISVHYQSRVKDCYLHTEAEVEVRDNHLSIQVSSRKIGISIYKTENLDA